MTPSQKELHEKIQALESELTNPELAAAMDEEIYRKKKTLMELFTRQFLDATGKSILLSNLQEKKEEVNPLQFCNACFVSQWKN